MKTQDLIEMLEKKKEYLMNLLAITKNIGDISEYNRIEMELEEINVILNKLKD